MGHVDKMGHADLVRFGVESLAQSFTQHTPYSKYPLVSGYHVDPLLEKEVFAMENQVFPKTP